MTFCFNKEYAKMTILKRSGARNLTNRFLSVWIVQYLKNLVRYYISVRDTQWQGENENFEF